MYHVLKAILLVRDGEKSRDLGSTMNRKTTMTKKVIGIFSRLRPIPVSGIG